MHRRITQKRSRSGWAVRGARIAGLLAGCLLAVSPAAAQDEEEEEDEPDWYSRKGVYLQTLFTSNVGGYAFPAPFPDDPVYSTGVAAGLGYRIHKHLAAEVAGDWVSGWGLGSMGGMDAGDLTAGTIGLNAKGYLKGGRFQPFGVLGLGAAYADVVRSSVNMGLSWDMAARMGAGFEWYFNPELGMSFMTTYVRPVGIGDDLDGVEYVSIGIGVFARFGRY